MVLETIPTRFPLKLRTGKHWWLDLRASFKLFISAIEGSVIKFLDMIVSALRFSFPLVNRVLNSFIIRVILLKVMFTIVSTPSWLNGILIFLSTNWFFCRWLLRTLFAFRFWLVYFNLSLLFNYNCNFFVSLWRERSLL